MVTFRSLDAITQAMVDFIRITKPDADVKPGTIIRDVGVDPAAQELAKLYVELRNISNLQSLASATGLTLDRLGANFGMVRGQGSGASGVAILTVNSLDFDINIPAGSTLTARNGFTFRTQAQTAFRAANASVYRANAIRLSSMLEMAGITDSFALEVAVQAVSPGSGGNIPKFSLVGNNIAGISNSTNAETFSGGANTESDDAFRARILGVFGGANIGTTLGYRNALLKDSRIIDVLPVEPGDPLMTRDGTQIATNDAGENIVIQSGTGGKVDLYIQGNGLEQLNESYIYKDASGKGDPTDPKNDFVLGQRGVSTALDFQQRRRTLLRAGTPPFQPIDSIVSVSGSLSGPNFILKYTDEEGNTRGSYELVKDTGAFGGSVFGFDKIHFISNNIELDDEPTTKGIFNGRDALDFTDITKISRIHQNIVLRNESAILSSTNRAKIRVRHTPVLSVDRVVNSTTGERYSVTNLNPNGVAGDINTDGFILISGNTLPVPTDNVEVSYLWDAEFDGRVDFDNLENSNIFRTVQDSIDWGYSNSVKEEEQTILYSLADGYHVLLNHSASRVIDVNTVVIESPTNTLGKLVVSQLITNIKSIKDSDGREVYFTADNNGSFSGYEITLPTDSLLPNGEIATVTYNVTDLYSPDGYELGSYTGSKVFLPSSVTSAGTTVFVNYVASVNTIIPTTALSSLPATGSQNQFVIGASTVGDQPISNVYSGSTIVRNLRFAPSYLRINVQGIANRGRLTVQGTIFTRVQEIVTITQDSLTINLRDSILSSQELDSIPSTGYIALIDKVERVTVVNDVVQGIEAELDTLNYEIKNTKYSNGTAIYNSSLSSTQFRLAATDNNLSEIPSTGQRLRITYYYVDTNYTESIPVSFSGVYFSSKKYAYISSLSLASGFTGLTGNIAGNITVSNFNQPLSSSTYLPSYSYVAPKEGERITITYNYNKLIGDATFNIEDVRPITADVLVKAAVPLEVDISMQVVPTPAYANNTTNLSSNIEETVTVFSTANGLNSILDASDIINAVYSVPGVDRVVLTKFNLTGNTGILKSVSADRNQYIVAGNIQVEIEER